MEQLWVTQGKNGTLIIHKTSTHFEFISGGAIQGVASGLVSDLPELLQRGKYGPLEPAKRLSGEYHWRMWRTGAPSPNKLGDDQRATWLSTVRATRMLYERMNALFAAVEPLPSQRGTFGFLQRELIILACTEVESAWRSVLNTQTGAPTDKRWCTNDYVRLLEPMRLDEWVVSLSVHRDFGQSRPFRGWDAQQPTQSLAWYDAYNAVKHGRENNLKQATLGNAVDAVAAAFVMTVAQFGFSHIYGTGLFASVSIFHPDAFQVVEQPKWLATEVYIPPSKNRFVKGEYLGHSEWTATLCPIP